MNTPPIGSNPPAYAKALRLGMFALACWFSLSACDRQAGLEEEPRVDAE